MFFQLKIGMEGTYWLFFKDIFEVYWEDFGENLKELLEVEN